MEFYIGKLKIPNNICLAPMAGTSTVAFRSICHEFGSGYAPTELVSARSIFYNGIERSFKYLVISPQDEGITAIQLFGAEEEDFDYAMKSIFEDERLNKVNIIDINMGCPVSKVVKTGAGAALMKEPHKASKIASMCVKVANSYGKEVTVKMRTGFDNSNMNGTEFIKYIADTGVKSICVHGRTAAMLYSGKANIEMIAKMHEAIQSYDISFIANGDVKDRESLNNMFNETGADAVMIGRAAVGNPWIFEELSRENKKATKPTFKDKSDMLLRELTMTMKYKDEVFAVREMRPSMIQYVKGFAGAANLKTRLCNAVTFDEVAEILRDHEAK